MKRESARGSPAITGADNIEIDGRIQVGVQSNLIWDNEELRGSLSSSAGFVSSRLSGGLDSVLSDCEKVGPCVLIADLSLVEAADPTAFGERVDFGRAIRILVIGPRKAQGLVEKLLHMGCRGLLTEDVSPKILLKAIRSVALGEFWADRTSTSRVVRHLLLQQSSLSLTPREKEILWLIGQGLTNREMSDRLYVTRDTIRCHIKNVYGKIGIHDRRGAAAYARKHLAEAFTPKSRPQKDPTAELSARAREWVSQKAAALKE
jgi:DNA-binding NarL/FixJ family response regulator